MVVKIAMMNVINSPADATGVAMKVIAAGKDGNKMNVMALMEVTLRMSVY